MKNKLKNVFQGKNDIPKSSKLPQQSTLIAKELESIWALGRLWEGSGKGSGKVSGKGSGKALGRALGRLWERL